MALINRITRLFRADMHAVLDRLEEPDTLLRQAVREMEEDIVADEQRLKLLQHEQDQLVERQKDIGQSLLQFDEELELCFSTDQEVLARGLVKRKLEAQRFDKFLYRKGEALKTTLAELEQRLTENRKRLQAMQQKLELLSEEIASSNADKGLQPEISVSEDEVDVAFLREQQQRQPS